MLTVLSMIRTLPETIKMAPVIPKMERHSQQMRSVVCVTGQHRGAEGIHFVWPVHHNPKVRGPVRVMLSGIKNISLLEPLDYFFTGSLDA